MSDDFVNQLTLSCLISKDQLYKLNARRSNNANQIRQQEIQEFEKPLTLLFQNLLVGQVPPDLLVDVKTVFDAFVDKSIYYFKVQAKHQEEQEEIEAGADIEDDENDDDENRVNKWDYEEDKEEEEE